MDFKHILCAVDLSDQSPAVIAYAAAMRTWFGARLTLVHVFPTLEPGASTVAIDRDRVIGEMRRVAVDSEPAVGEAEYAVERGDPSAAIVDQAIARGADLIVMGTHGRRGFDRLLLGSVAERVLRKSTCPILTVPPAAVQPRAGQAPFTRIVCPVDFSPSSLQAFGFALALARRAGGALTVLHVVEWLADDEPRAHDHFDVPEYRRHLTDAARARLHELVAGEETRGCEVAEVVATDAARRAILRSAIDRGADLIVMGAQGRGALGLALFGSTTEQVLRAAVWPVLTVRA